MRTGGETYVIGGISHVTITCVLKEGIITYAEVCTRIAQVAELSEAQSEQLATALFEAVGESLSAGEEVAVEELGRFYTVEYPSEVVEDPPGSGHQIITLPTIEPEFDPDPKLVRQVVAQIQEHPERFTTADDEEETPVSVSTPLAVQKIEMPVAAVPEPVPVAPPKPAEKPLGRASRIEYRDLSRVKVDHEVLLLLPEKLANQLKAVPLGLESGVLELAMVDPEDFDAIQLVRKETGLTIKPVLSSQEDIQTVLDQYTGLQAEVQEVIAGSDFSISSKELEGAADADVDQTNDNAPTAKIVYSLLSRAVKERASDIHVEPYEHRVVVRFRVDGVLKKRVELPKEIQSALVSRLKIMSNLKIDEQRLPQDGRLQIIYDKRPIDFRLSTIPVVFGEKVVMRILDKTVGIVSLDEVGLADRGLEVLKRNSERTHGMILVTGPTGSGKTTSLYAVLGRLMNENVNILTLEDPVEYQIESINQSQVHAEIGYTFASGLRAVVRQDPDIVMLGEIRDQETADMAIHAALTGHVVLSTLHTNDAAGAFPRLIDMKIEPFLITSSVHTVIGQRLARKICPECREGFEVTEAEMTEVKGIIATMPEDVQKEFSKEKMQFQHGKGCDACGTTGYHGRIGIFEVLDVTEPIRELVLKRSSGAAITELGVKEGMVTMIQDGIIKALRGQTTLSEVWRVTRE